MSMFVNNHKVSVGDVVIVGPYDKKEIWMGVYASNLAVNRTVRGVVTQLRKSNIFPIEVQLDDIRSPVNFPPHTFRPVPNQSGYKLNDIVGIDI